MLFRPCPTLRLYHSCLHEIHSCSLSFSTAHPCPSWMTASSDRKMLLFYWPPVDGDISILLYCYCCWRPTTQGLSYTQEPRRVSSGRKGHGPVGKSVMLCVCVCVCVCVHLRNVCLCVSLIIVVCSLESSLALPRPWGLQDRCGKPLLSLDPQGPATLAVSLFTAALKLHGL